MKDTIIAYPGQVTRIVVRWAPTSLPTTVGSSGSFPFDPSGGGPDANGDYQFGCVWHCHIIDHEDNEMMRPDIVVAQPNTTRSFVKGTDY